MFETVFFDITGGCNAKCPLCVTARETFGKPLHFISVPDFGRVLDRLLTLELARPGYTVVRLFNWGEPIVHPNLNGIVAELNARKLYAGISTNVSKKTNFTVSTSGFRQFTFSVPGWSQASYDKIHGLKFDRVVANMEATISNMRATGFRGRFELSFHVYQFNAFEELEAAQRWAKRHRVDFHPYYAYINDYTVMKKHRKGELPPDTVNDFSRKLFLHYVDDLIASQPADWECPQWDNKLTINHKGQVLLCCVVPESHEASVLGSIFELSREEILSKKKTSKECDDCLGCGIAYWGHTFVPVLPERKLAAGSWKRLTAWINPGRTSHRPEATASTASASSASRTVDPSPAKKSVVDAMADR